jgi:cytochrome c-type biogenesis protein CcmH
MMTEFVIIASIMLLFALLIIILPLLNRSNAVVDTEADRKALNIASYKQRLSEIEADCSQGLISRDDADRLCAELKLALLEDAGSTAASVASYQGGRGAIAVCAVVFAVVAVFTYRQVGAINDVIVADQWQQITIASQSGEKTEAQINRMKKDLIDHLESSDNPGNQYLLASMLMRQQSYAEAAVLLKVLVKQMPQDMQLAAEYVQAEYLANDRQIDGRLEMIISRVLTADPRQPTLLALVAMDAYGKEDYSKALQYWQKLQRVTPTDTQNGQLLADTIVHVQELIASGGQTTAERAEAERQVDSVPTVDTSVASVDVTVSLADSVDVASGDTVFIYVRAAGGPKMPLAIHRTTVSKLPLTVTLDDTMSMMPDLNISSFDHVEVVARVSKSGQVTPAAGDYQIISDSFEPLQAAPISLEISQALQ